MIELLGVDYSWGRPDPRELYRVGYRFAYRYLSPGVGRNAGKNLTAPERDALFAAGLSIGLVWESGKGDALTGAPGGLAAAKIAVPQAIELGQPTDRPIVFTIDFDAQPDQYGVCADYMKAAEDVCQRGIGIYGGAPQLEAMHDRGVGAIYWQTLAWSKGRISPLAAVYQRNGSWSVEMVDGAYDEDVAFVTDFGQWPAPVQTDDRRRRAAGALAMTR